jgi:hypothetical protein
MKLSYSTKTKPAMKTGFGIGNAFERATDSINILSFPNTSPSSKTVNNRLHGMLTMSRGVRLMGVRTIRAGVDTRQPLSRYYVVSWEQSRRGIYQRNVERQSMGNPSVTQALACLVVLVFKKVKSVYQGVCYEDYRN